MNIQYGVRRTFLLDDGKRHVEDIEATDRADAEELIRAITDNGAAAALITRPVGDWTEGSSLAANPTLATNPEETP